ncbi:hypothetical protein SUGI_0646300 [Cryptomeria japonica]|nr:hypothetical protein SUGI_0646300 [Cryptomeria japonica]
MEKNGTLNASKEIQEREIHDHESHGLDATIDENTAPEDVKGPSILQRIKEEIQALLQTVFSKKKSNPYEELAK